jgi:hypothetical protein
MPVQSSSSNPRVSGLKKSIYTWSHYFEETAKFSYFFYLHAGEWWHAGFHLTTAIVGPTILTLPYVFKGLGWALGFFCLTVMGMVTFYAYYLMSKVLDYCEKDGRRHIRFRELAADVLGNYRDGKRAAGFVLFW